MTYSSPFYLPIIIFRYPCAMLLFLNTEGSSCHGGDVLSIVERNVTNQNKLATLCRETISVRYTTFSYSAIVAFVTDYNINSDYNGFKLSYSSYYEGIIHFECKKKKKKKKKTPLKFSSIIAHSICVTNQDQKLKLIPTYVGFARV